MAYIYSNIDIDVDDFWNACSVTEKKQLCGLVIKWEGAPKDVKKMQHKASYNATNFAEKITLIANNFLQITKEEEDIILKIAKRF